jgi:hypothetical protein
VTVNVSAAAGAAVMSSASTARSGTHRRIRPGGYGRSALPTLPERLGRH